MDKKSKRESRKTGMTKDKEKALQSIRELKNSGKSRLAQAMEVSKNIF
jgi:hypothetical protein